MAGPAGAADAVRAPDKYVGFGTSYLSPGDRPVDYGIGFNMAYAGKLGLATWLEARLFTSVLESGVSTQPDFYQSGVGLDLIQTFGDDTGAHFFVLAGGGAAMNDVTPDDDDGGSYYGNGGIGFRGSVWKDWGVRPRLDVRYAYDTIGEGSGDVLVGLTLEVPPKREKVVERIVEVEKIVEVPVEVEKIVEKETICVVPPTEQAVAPAAVPADTDADGILDAQDKCPNTLKGARVDGGGCVVEEQKISLPNIEFESGKTVLAAGGKEKLESVVQFLQSQAAVQVDVFGHTDAQGADAFNQKLSDGRAKSVMEYLVSRGVDAGRLSSKGFGETQPIASNETKEGRAQNRRVELLVRVSPAAATTESADGDRDGVPDALDKCRGTLAGARVDPAGCVNEEQTIGLLNVEFESGTAVLTSADKEKLEGLVTFLVNQTEVRVEVSAFARGVQAPYQKVAEDRARAIVDYLVGRGIAAERLSATGVGGSQNDRLKLFIRPRK